MNLSQNALIVTVNDKTSSLYGSNYFWIGVSVQNSYTNSKILDLCFEIYKDDILLENLSSSFVGAYKNNRVAIAGNSEFFAHLYYAYSGSGEYKIVVKNRAGIVIDAYYI